MQLTFICYRLGHMAITSTTFSPSRKTPGAGKTSNESLLLINFRPVQLSCPVRNSWVWPAYAPAKHTTHNTQDKGHYVLIQQRPENGMTPGFFHSRFTVCKYLTLIELNEEEESSI